MGDLIGVISFEHHEDEYDSEFNYENVDIQIFNRSRIIHDEHLTVDRLIIEGGKGFKIYQLLHILSVDPEDSTHVEWINLGYFSTEAKALSKWRNYREKNPDVNFHSYSIREYCLDEEEK